MREAVLTDITGAVIHDVVTTPFGELVSQTASDGALGRLRNFLGRRFKSRFGTFYRAQQTSSFAVFAGPCVGGQHAPVIRRMQKRKVSR
jgi:hypothetical protein